MQQSGQPPGGSQHPHGWPPFQWPGARTTCGIIIWPYTGIGMTLDCPYTGCGCTTTRPRTYIFRGEEHGLGGRLALGLPVRRLRVCPRLLGHDDGLRLGLGLPVHRLRLHGDRLHGDRRDDDRLDDDGLGGRLNDCSLDDCSLDDMAWLLSLSSTKSWREARRLLGLHRVGTLRPGERLVAPRPHSVPRIDLQRPKQSEQESWTEQFEPRGPHARTRKERPVRAASLFVCNH